MLLTPTQENYIETIYLIRESGRPVRVRELVTELRIKASTVNEGLSALKRLGYIEQAPYKPITLTVEGEQEARQILKRHRVITTYLSQVLGLEKCRAEADACRIEHYLSGTAIDRMSDFLDFLAVDPEFSTRLSNRFSKYLDTSTK